MTERSGYSLRWFLICTEVVAQNQAEGVRTDQRDFGLLADPVHGAVKTLSPPRPAFPVETEQLRQALATVCESQQDGLQEQWHIEALASFLPLSITSILPSVVQVADRAVQHPAGARPMVTATSAATAKGFLVVSK